MNTDVKEWIKYAEADLILAKMALDADIYEYACFMPNKLLKNY